MLTRAVTCCAAVKKAGGGVPVRKVYIAPPAVPAPRLTANLLSCSSFLSGGVLLPLQCPGLVWDDVLKSEGSSKCQKPAILRPHSAAGLSTSAAIGFGGATARVDISTTSVPRLVRQWSFVPDSSKPPHTTSRQRFKLAPGPASRLFEYLARRLHLRPSIPPFATSTSGRAFGLLLCDSNYPF